MSIRGVAHKEAAEADEHPKELIKLFLNGDHDLYRFHDIIVTVWQTGEVPLQWEDASMQGFVQEEEHNGVWQLQSHIIRDIHWQSDAQACRHAFDQLLRARGHPAGGAKWLPSSPFDLQLCVCDPATPRAGAAEEHPALRVLRRSHRGISLRRPTTAVTRAQPIRRAPQSSGDHPPVPRRHECACADRREDVLRLVRRGPGALTGARSSTAAVQ